MRGLFMFLFFSSLLAGLYFLVRLIISLIKKDGSRKKYGKGLVACITVFIASFVGVGETHEPTTNSIQTESLSTNTEIKETNGQVLIHDNGEKKYYADTENMYLDRGGFYTLDVITESSKDRTFLKKDTWNFNRDENTVFYRVYNVVGDTESSGMVIENDLATIIYSFIKNHPDYLKKVDNAPTLFKQSTKEIKEKQKTQVTNNNSSNEVYVGTYSSGLKAYLLVDTLKMDTYRDFKVTIKAIDDKNVVYVDYDFSGSPGNPDTWRNSQGYSGKIDYDNPSVETNIRNYYIEKWSDYVVNYKPGNRK